MNRKKKSETCDSENFFSLSKKNCLFTTIFLTLSPEKKIYEKQKLWLSEDQLIFACCAV